MNLPSAQTGPAPVPARFFDGRSAGAQSARLWFLPGPELVVETPLLMLRHPARDIQLDRAVGDAPRFLRLPEGRSCELTDLPALDAALSAWPASAGLRSRAQGWPFITATFLTLAVAVVLFFVHGVPLVARQLAFMLPADTVTQLGRDSLAELDATWFEPSRLSWQQREHLLRRSRIFLEHVGESPDRRIEFRSAPRLGANAMALPSGVIVFTDDLVRLLENDDQFLAVLAHECGHVEHRHSLRGILQHSATAMAITLAAGKQRSADSLQAALTAGLVNSRHSRDFEFEADAYAAELLARADMDPRLLGEALDLLEARHHATAAHEGDLKGYLRSHPATDERKQRLDRIPPPAP